MYDDDFPFDMVDLVYLLPLNIRHKRPGSWDADCPFCGDCKGKMNLNLKKKVFRCNRCGESGGMLHLYGRMTGVDNKTACDEIKAALGKGEQVQSYLITKKEVEKSIPEVPQSDLASIEDINRTYTALLTRLPLTPTHEQKLLTRGFTREQIERNGYKSTPAFGLKKLTEQLIKAGCVVKGVPGFYVDGEGDWSINFHVRNSGFLVPVRNIEGLITGMQIRSDRPYKGRKYIWLSSSDKNMGVTSGSPVHFVGKEGEEVVFVTEGPLKADLANALNNRTFVAVAGVNLYGNLSLVIRRLKKNGTKLCYEAYDMDKLMKLICHEDCEEKCVGCELKEEKGTIVCPKKQIKRANIQNGCRNLYRICREEEMKIKSLTWDKDENGDWSGNIKGVDDYLYQLSKKEE